MNLNQKKYMRKKIILPTKKCNFCKKQRRVDLMYTTQYKFKKAVMCNYCFSSYQRGKILVNNSWVLIKKPKEKIKKEKRQFYSGLTKEQKGKIRDAGYTRLALIDYQDW